MDSVKEKQPFGSDQTRDSWLPEPPSLEPEQADVFLETDVIVCGAGIAGVAAAREVTERGESCILFEKTTCPQARSGQFSVIGGELLKRQWNIDNRSKAQEIIGYLMREGGYRVKQTILNRFAENIGADFDWYLEGLPDVPIYYAGAATDVPPPGTKIHIMLMQHPIPSSYDPAQERTPAYPYTVQIRPSHASVLRGNLALAEKTGRLSTYFKTPVKKLLREENGGRVYGVVALDYDGTLYYARARKAVILTTGDYSGDQAMLQRFCPWVADHKRLSCGVAPDHTPANTGDGHKMGLWIGAQMEAEPHCSNAHNMGSAIGATPFLALDVYGRRFMNEDCPGSYLESQLTMLKDRTAWQIFDAAWPEQIPNMPFGHGTCSQVLDEAAVARGECFDDLLPFDGYASQKWLDHMIEEGLAVCAETLEELFEKTGMPVAGALASVKRYNMLAENGNDEDFGKKTSRLFSIKQPPYYAAKLSPAPLLCCHSGLESDEFCHCYDTERNVIPGLYIAGNVQGNRFSVEYPTTLPGLSHSMALSLGRQAGRSASESL